MKWVKKPGPKHEETRISREFAFFPFSCDDGFVVWLDWVYVVEEYDAKMFNSWFPVKFLSQKPE